LSFAGVDKYTQFSCEAHNKKGVSTSREANINIKVPPSPVTGVRVTKRESSKLVLSWSPGHDGFSPITKCHIRVRLVPAQRTARRWRTGQHQLSDQCKVKEVSRREGEATETRLVNVMAPPFQSEVAGLQAVTCYNISVSCSNEVGASPFTAWIQSNTTEGVPSVFPRNVTVRLNGSRLLVTWKPPPDDKINGILRGYEVIVRHGPNMDKAIKVHTNTAEAFVEVQEFNSTYSVQVAACTKAGSGMVSPRQLLFVPGDKSAAPPTSSPDDGVPDSLYVVLGVVCGFCLLMIILFGAVCIHKRTSNLFFWRIFGGAEKPQPVVEYTPQRSYNRSAARVTLANLGISEELKAKLQDVMVARSLLSIGKVLGEGEFGSVVEGHLRQTDGTFEKVAVKTMKCESFSQREIEEFLNEAACMKDFSHPNVIGLLDFGLSKKIYSGDYYRQGRIAKMPVKWIAVESLADRVFTVKSDVWAFGVTMWEIATLGMTPYPGIQNHEIYDYLLAGHRLKQPAGCLDEIYEIMSSCWRPDPSERPLFPQLREMLEKVAEKLPESCSKNDIIYINTSFPEEDPAVEMIPAEGPLLNSSPCCSREAAEDSVVTVDVH
ncbi:unnamed protein product, partial [Tetraodon nigroviridis]